MLAADADDRDRPRPLRSAREQAAFARRTRARPSWPRAPAAPARRRADGVDGRPLRPPAALRRPRRRLPLHRRRRQRVRRLQPGRPERDVRLRAARRARGDRRARRARAAVPAPGRGGRSRPPSCSPSATGCPPGSSRSSASGANAEAIRLARHRTGRDADRRLRRPLPRPPRRHARRPATSAAAQPELLGVNPRAAADTRSCRSTTSTRSSACSPRGDVAAVITEPALTNVGVVLPDDGFLAGVRALAREHGALLILDETHTQTVAYGGLTRAWGLEPDVVTLGKSLGGGVPIGAYGMTGDLRDWMERHRDAYGRARRARHRRDDVREPALARRRRRGAARDPDAGGVRAHRRARRAARRRDRGRRRAPRAAVARAPARRALGLLPRAASCRATPTDAERSLDHELIDARRLHMANRGVWDAIASAGPGRRRSRTSRAADVGRRTSRRARARSCADVAGSTRLRRATSGSSNASLVCDSPVFASG